MACMTDYNVTESIAEAWPPMSAPDRALEEETSEKIKQSDTNVVSQKNIENKHHHQAKPRKCGFTEKQ